MSRFITLLLLGFAAYTLYKRFKAAPPRVPKPPVGGAEKMCKCSYCNTHSPQSLGITAKNGQFFCSQEHQRLYLAAQDQHNTE